MGTFVQLESGTVLETSNPALWPEGKRLSREKGKSILKEEARVHLANILKPGGTVYTILRHVSSSGMSRHISLVVIEGGEPRDITGWAGRLLGYTHHKDGGLVVGGCGMDMGYHVVYSLSAAMFPKGTKDKPDGGYVLEHRWL